MHLFMQNQGTVYKSVVYLPIVHLVQAYQNNDKKEPKISRIVMKAFQPALVHWNIMKFWGVQATDKVRVPEKEKFIET